MSVRRLRIVGRFDATNPFLVAEAGIKDGRVFFQYTPECVKAGLSFSPEFLDLSSRVHSFKASTLPGAFMGLPGLLADVLPDSWGRTLFRLAIAQRQLDTRSLTALDLLSFIGQSGLGALAFEPTEYRKPSTAESLIQLDVLLQEVDKVASTTEYVDESFLCAALPSGGARPKVLLQKQGETLTYSTGAQGEAGQSWILKFPSKEDGVDQGKLEFICNQLAKAAGLNVPESALWSGRYFAVRRFDRDGDHRLHMHSFANLLHRDFVDFSFSYDDFFVVTKNLTESVHDTLEAMRRALFNRVFCNMDDHAKNHAFIMDARGKWHLSPAYDLTFSDRLGVHPLEWLGTSNGLPDISKIIEQAVSLDIRRADILDAIDTVLGAKAHLRGFLEQLELASHTQDSLAFLLN